MELDDYMIIYYDDLKVFGESLWQVLKAVVICQSASKGPKPIIQTRFVYRSKTFLMQVSLDQIITNVTSLLHF